MSHPLAARLRRSRLGDDASIPEQIGGAVIDAVKPRILEIMPEVSQAFVDNAVPRIQQRLVDLQPQLNELAIQSAQAVLNDGQIRETVRAAVAESTENTRKELRSGLLKLGAGILMGVLAIELVEPWLPGRKGT